MSSRPRTALLLALVALAVGCRRASPPPAAETPVVLVSIDTLRSDRLPAYGYRGVETPAIDALRRDAVLFERAYAHVPLTLPSHVSILTGLLPPEHGVRDNAGYRFDGALHASLPGLLRGAGYATGAAVSSYVLRRATGVDAGFDFYDEVPEDPGAPGLGGVQRIGPETVTRLLGWLDGVRSRRVFLFLHLYEPHARYAPPEPFASRYADPYDGEIAAADAALGRFLDELRRRDLYDDAWIVLLSDHGEGLGDHGEQEHGTLLYREALQVPLLVKLPASRRAGDRVARPVQLVDVAPTLLGGLGLARPPGLPGRDLLAALSPGSDPAPIYGETFYPRNHFGWSELRSLIVGRDHLVEGRHAELFDLDADPAERFDRLATERRRAAELRERLATVDARFAPPATTDAETRAKLAALGYLGGAVGGVRADRSDPRLKLAALGRFERARFASQELRYADVVAELRPLVADEPDLLDAWSLLALACEKLGRDREALAAVQRALKLAPDAAELAVVAAALHLRLGDPAAARAHAELAPETPRAIEIVGQVALADGDLATALGAARRLVAAGESAESLRRDLVLALLAAGRAQEAAEIALPLPTDAIPPTLGAAALALSEVGRHEEARQLADRALAADASYARGWLTAGVVALRQDDVARARSALEKAVELDPRLAEAWNSLGVALYRTSGSRAAIAAWQRTVAIDPGQFDALFNLGLVAAEAGDRALARRSLERFVAAAPENRFAAELERARRLLEELGA